MEKPDKPHDKCSLNLLACDLIKEGEKGWGNVQKNTMTNKTVLNIKIIYMILELKGVTDKPSMSFQ